MDIEKHKNGTSVFIVEDELIQAILLEKIIERFGYRVVGSAKSGQDAIRLIEQLQPDVITMDIQLEGTIDGITVAEKVRKFSSPDIIFITGNSDTLNYSRAQEAGFIAFLTKPVQKDELKTALHECLLVQRNGI